MIIRRRHTRDFTTIGNALFRDARLSLDEIGMLAWLLSQPNDWQIRRPALMRRHKIGEKNLGRDSLRRIIRNLMITGWLRAQKTRLSDGTFHVEYQVHDEPGSGMSEAEAIEALSLVSSEVVDDASEEDEADPMPPDKPPTPQPGVAEPGVAGRMWTKEKSLPNPDSLNTDSTKPAAIWSNVREAWTGDILSPLVCEQLFAALSQTDRQLAFDGIGPYLANCRAKSQKVCDLSTYLKQRRYAGKLAVAVSSVPIFGNTPRGFRWLEYRKAKGEPTGFMEDCWRQGKPWFAPTEWPPALPDKQSTGPPIPNPMHDDRDEDQDIRNTG